MELGEFNSDYLAKLLENLSLENKTLVFLENYNANLLKHGIDADISNSLDLPIHPFFFQTLPQQLTQQQHWQPLLMIYSPITATLLTSLVIMLSHCLTIMVNS